MEWAAAGILAVIYLGWFGNHIAAKYRLLYGKLPEVLPDPPRRKVYREPVVESWENAMTCAGSYTIRSFDCSAVEVSRPGSIIRLESWQ
jgi:hypothetical protein